MEGHALRTSLSLGGLGSITMILLCLGGMKRSCSLLISWETSPRPLTSLQSLTLFLESVQDAAETGKEPVEFTIKFAPRRPPVQVLLNLAQKCDKIKPKLRFRNIKAWPKSTEVSGSTQADISGMMRQGLDHMLLELVTEYSIYVSSCLFIYHFFCALLCGRMMTTSPELGDYTAW